MENLRRVTAADYFRELVTKAMVHQHVRSSDQTSVYVVNLLAGFANRRKDDDKALGLRLLQALQAGGHKQQQELQDVGDLSLFISGFFGNSLQETQTDISYYITLGKGAYGNLSRRNPLAEVFGELSAKFTQFVDVLDEVSSNTVFASKDRDLLRLYKRWLATGSRRTEEQLRAAGIVPNAAVLKLRVQ